MARQQVLIVDDTAEVRQELRRLLPLAGEIEIVGEAADGRDAVRLALALRPQVILLDLQMPVMDGFEAAREIKRSCPRCRIVALTVHDDEASRRKACEIGIDVLLVKGTPLQALVAAIVGSAVDSGE